MQGGIGGEWYTAPLVTLMTHFRASQRNVRRGGGGQPQGARRS